MRSSIIAGELPPIVSGLAVVSGIDVDRFRAPDPQTAFDRLSEGRGSMNVFVGDASQTGAELQWANLRSKLGAMATLSQLDVLPGELPARKVGRAARTAAVQLLDLVFAGWQEIGIGSGSLKNAIPGPILVMTGNPKVQIQRHADTYASLEKFLPRRQKALIAAATD